MLYQNVERGIRMFESLAEDRILRFKKTGRGQAIRFAQNIHDYIRRGELLQLTAPLSVYWAVTDRCNLSCVHCYAAGHHAFHEMPIQECFKLIDNLARWGVFELILEGGEPFLREDIIPILKHAKEKGFLLTVISNGTLLNEKKWEGLYKTLDWDVDTLQISLDGSQVVCDHIRGQGTYEKVISNLELYARQADDNVLINTVVSAGNYRDMESMLIDLRERTAVRRVHFSPLMHVGNGSSLSSLSIDDGIVEMNRLKEGVGCDMELSGTFVPDHIVLQNQKIWECIKRKGVSLGCCAGRSKIYIAPNGEVYPCTFMREEKRSLGNVLVLSLEEIWGKSGEENSSITACSAGKSLIESNSFIPYCAAQKDETQMEELAYGL